MATAESVKTKIQGLINTANATTGNSDADLTTAFGALIAGYGQGSGEGLAYDMGEFTLDADAKWDNVNHDLGAVPDFVLVWSDEFVGTTNEYGNVSNIGFVWFNNLTGMTQRLTSTASTTGLTICFTQAANATVMAASSMTSTAYCTSYSQNTDTTIRLNQSGSNNYWRAGKKYNYFVAQAWWNTNNIAE